MNTYVIIIICLLGIISLVLFVYEIYRLYIWFTAEKVEATVKKSLTNSDSEILQYLYEINVDEKIYTLPGPKFETFNPLLILFPEVKVGKTETVRLNRRKMKILKNPISLILEIFLVLLIVTVNIIGIVVLFDMMSYR